MKIYGFIFARGGSKGIKNKNIKLFNGKPLICYSIDIAKKSKYINKIYVSTDSVEIAKIAKKNGATVPFLRPKELSDDNSAEINAWKHIIHYLNDIDDDFDIFVSIPTTTPLKEVYHIDNCIEKFLNSEGDLLITATNSSRNPYYNMIKKNDEGYCELFNSNYLEITNRQSFEKIMDVTTLCYISRPNIILNKMPNINLLSNDLKTIVYEIDKISSIDLDDDIDWQIADQMYSNRISSKLEFSVLNNLDLSDKIAIVTGGLGYIGYRICETLLEMKCQLLIVDISTELSRKRHSQLEKTFNRTIDFFDVDLTNMTILEKFIHEVRNIHDTIDIIINCAAFTGDSDLKGWSCEFESQLPEVFSQCIDLNVKVPFILIQQLINQLKCSTNASVINIGSIYGIKGNDFTLYHNTTMNSPVAYSVSKAGLNMLTKYLSSLYGIYNIRFNNIILGGIKRNQPVEFIKKYTNKVPLNRMGTENDIKGAIVFLCSNLSSYVTGQDIIIDGGLSICI